MSSPAGFSAQTLCVLTALSLTPASWRHGYELAQETTLKSGTLYPILIRLADRGLVEACWEADQPAGRPRRHLYRLTAAGLVAVDSVATRIVGAAVVDPNANAKPAVRRGQRRLADEGA